VGLVDGIGAVPARGGRGNGRMESGDGREWREIEPKPSPSWPNDSIFPLVTGKPDMESEIIPNSWLIEVPLNNAEFCLAVAWYK